MDAVVNIESGLEWLNRMRSAAISRQCRQLGLIEDANAMRVAGEAGAAKTGKVRFQPPGVAKSTLPFGLFIRSVR